MSFGFLPQSLTISCNNVMFASKYHWHVYVCYLFCMHCCTLSLSLSPSLSLALWFFLVVASLSHLAFQPDFCCRRKASCLKWKSQDLWCPRTSFWVARLHYEESIFASVSICRFNIMLCSTQLSCHSFWFPTLESLERCFEKCYEAAVLVSVHRRAF